MGFLEGYKSREIDYSLDTRETLIFGLSFIQWAIICGEYPNIKYNEREIASFLQARKLWLKENNKYPEPYASSFNWYETAFNWKAVEMLIINMCSKLGGKFNISKIFNELKKLKKQTELYRLDKLKKGAILYKTSDINDITYEDGTAAIKQFVEKIEPQKYLDEYDEFIKWKKQQEQSTKEQPKKTRILKFKD